MKSKKKKISRGRTKKHKKTTIIVKKRQTQKNKKIIGGYAGSAVRSMRNTVGRYMRNTYEGTQQSIRSAKAVYEIKKLYDTEQGQYLLSELGRISYEKNPKIILKQIMKEVVPKDKDNFFFG